jgi:hypothetical protein
MKRALLTLMAGLFISSLAFANKTNLFTYDAVQVDQEMSQLQTLENFVAVNPGVTLTGMQEEDNALVSDLNLSACEFGGTGSVSGDRALGIPSFLWGCCLGPLGVLIVYLVAEDSGETKKSFMGCVVWGAAWAIYYIVALLTYY